MKRHYNSVADYAYYLRRPAEATRVYSVPIGGEKLHAGMGPELWDLICAWRRDVITEEKNGTEAWRERYGKL